MRRQKKAGRRILSLGLSLALVLSVCAMTDTATASAAGKVKLSKKSVSVEKGSTVKVKVKNASKGSTITWKSKNTKIAKVKKVSANTKTATIKGVKKGNTKIIAKVSTTANGKKTTQKLKLPVKVKKKAAASSDDAQSSDSKSDTGTSSATSGEMDTTLSATELIPKMGQGWNLAKAMESCGVDDATAATATPETYETLWGNPVTTQEMIDGVKQSGFDTVRIPVAWSNMMSDDGKYTIDDAYLDRVEEIVNYCLNDDMYVVLNIHYDSAWWGWFGAADANGNAREDVRAEAWKKYEAIWTQLADRFGSYGDHLIFESANEELGDEVDDNNLGLITAVDGVVGNLTTAEVYDTVNQINQKFVDIVRASGGNNTYRQLLIAGFDTDLEKTVDSRFVMPTDSAATDGVNRLSVSIHYYYPSNYAISEDKTNTWYTDSWGSDADYTYLHTEMDKVKARFTDNGYGVIFGEYGVQLLSKKGIADYMKEVMTYSAKIGACPILWCDGIYNRNTCQIRYADIAEVLAEVTGATDIPLAENAGNTGETMEMDLASDDDSLTVVATWEGAWTRTNNVGAVMDGGNRVYDDNNGCIVPDTASGEVGQFVTESLSSGFTVQSNAFFWQLFITYDWATLNDPYLRVTISDEIRVPGGSGVTTESGKPDFQFAYCTGFDEGGDFGNGELDNATYNGKAFSVDKTELTGDNFWIEFSSGTPGATITKIEILDRK